jgi:NADPH2:quinone reductase
MTQDTMRAVGCTAFGPLEGLALAEVPRPSPKAGEVLIRVRAAGVSFLDCLIAQGKYQVKPPLPFAPGSEFAGEVAALGEGVTGLAPGQRVIGSGFVGGLAEYAISPAAGTTPIPAGMDFVDAAGFRINYATAWHALVDRAEAKAGESLLVLGAAGAVSAAAIEVGRLLGLHVIAAASTEAKRAYALGLGAAAAVDYTAADWRDRLKEIAGAKGVDIVFDPVGGPYAEPAFRSLAWKGRHLVVGFAAGTIPALPFNLALLKGASLVGVDVARFGMMHEPAKSQANNAKLLALFAEGKLKPEPGTIVPFGRFADAFAMVAGRAAVGRVVVTID